MNLVLITENYPISRGEEFIEAELLVIHEKFKNIYVVTGQAFSTITDRYVPGNAEVIVRADHIGLKRKLLSIPLVLHTFFFSELIHQLNLHGIRFFIQIFKIMFMDLVKADMVRKQLKRLIDQKELDLQNTVFYSYWNDYCALALAQMKQHNVNLRCVSRAHGWDVFRSRHKFPYLPFKKYILTQLNNTFSVSKAGKKELSFYAEKNESDKIIVSKLGISNTRIKKIDKEGEQIIICSCSGLTAVKRVHLLVDILAKIKAANVKWVHFGDGILKKELTLYAQKIIPDVDVDFKGMATNKEVLDFYENNYVTLFVNVSESEGIPVSIMEALSFGIPVVATDVGGNAEIVNADHGFLIDKSFDPELVSGLIDGYLAKSNDIQRKYRENAIQFWEQNHSSEKNYSTFANLLIGT